MPGFGVRDVSADKFISAYAAHLKANDKVWVTVADAVKAGGRGLCATQSNT